MTKKLKVGIVGCGYIADAVHIPSFKNLKKNIIMQAVCDKNKDLANRVAKKHNINNTYDDFSKMLLNEDLDIIDICTPPQIHASLAIPALEKDCHVLMEKPMALTTADCDKMIRVSNKHGVKLCIIHNKLFDPPFMKAQDLISNGVIGNFIGMRIFLSDHRDEMIMKKDHWIHKLPGGLIGETGPHVVYMSLDFLKKIKNVDIFAKNFLDHPWAPFDEFRIELEGEKAMSSISLSYSSNRHSLYVDIYGTEGVIYLDLCSMLLIHHGSRPSVKPSAFTRFISNIGYQTVKGALGNAFAYGTGRLKLGHDHLIEQFVNSIVTGSSSPVDGIQGKKTVDVMEQIVKRLNDKYSNRNSVRT